MIMSQDSSSIEEDEIFCILAVINLIFPSIRLADIENGCQRGDIRNVGGLPIIPCRGFQAGYFFFLAKPVGSSTSSWRPRRVSYKLLTKV
jgi:hypothetical protein